MAQKKKASKRPATRNSKKGSTASKKFVYHFGKLKKVDIRTLPVYGAGQGKGAEIIVC